MDFRRRPPVRRRRGHGSRALGREALQRRAWSRSGWAATNSRSPPRIFVRRSISRATKDCASFATREKSAARNAVREAVEILGAERIGHGIAVMHDPALAESLATRRSCSKIASQAICAPARWPSRPASRTHRSPIIRCRKFIERGLLVTLSTDDPAMFHTDLLTEYSHAASLGLSNGSFCNSPSRASTRHFFRRSKSANFLTNFAPRPNRRGCYNSVRPAGQQRVGSPAATSVPLPEFGQ